MGRCASMYRCNIIDFLLALMNYFFLPKVNRETMKVERRKVPSELSKCHDVFHCAFPPYFASYCLPFCRDALITSTINCATSFVSGFVIFMILGHMAETANLPIEKVATEGIH